MQFAGFEEEGWAVGRGMGGCEPRMECNLQSLESQEMDSS